MKIRTGFVSNSSSSSFIVMMSKASYQDMLDKMDDFEKEIVKYFWPKDKRMFGVDVIEMRWNGGEDDTFYGLYDVLMEKYKEFNDVPDDGKVDVYISELAMGVKKKVIETAKATEGHFKSQDY